MRILTRKWMLRITKEALERNNKQRRYGLRLKNLSDI